MTTLYKYLNKSELTDELSMITKKTLIVSAINPYIIPKNVLGNKLVDCFNCHRALLPRHPGRNEEAWAIYEGDSKAGITWHRVSEILDGGDILIQKRIILDEKITSFQLLKKENKLAEEGFEEILPQILDGSILGIKQDYSLRGRLHYSNDVPNGGLLDLNWSYKQASAFLRAMDYEELMVLGKPYLLWNNEVYGWKRYDFLPYKKVNENILKDDCFLLSREQGCIRLESIKKKIKLGCVHRNNGISDDGKADEPVKDNVQFVVTGEDPAEALDP